MAKQIIDLVQNFSAPVGEVFNTLTDHEAFGRLLKANIKRVVDGQGGHENGLGSVRVITPLPGMGFEETVVTFEPNKLMEYVVSKGSPIKNHKGRLAFTESGGVTQVHYTIEFEPKLPLPMVGLLLKKAIETPIRKGLSELSARYQ